MTRKNPPAKWVLPGTVNPAGRRCIQIEVPDDPAHIAAFRGALLALSSAYNWADDPSHTAKDVAAVWRDVIDAMSTWGCEMPTQLRVDDICTLSWSYDDWVTFASYDPSGCILATVEAGFSGWFNTALQQAIADGIIQGGVSQQGPQPAPIGSCKTFHVHLDANGKWACPIPVSSGDTVTLTNATGAWNDGSGLGAVGPWFCPDGGSYGLGHCGGGGSTQSGDPANTIYHMRPVAHVGTDWGDPALTWHIPAGYVNQVMEIQANDSNLGDNGGSIDFDVEVCNGSVCLTDLTTWRGEGTKISGPDTSCGYLFQSTAWGTPHYYPAACMIARSDWEPTTRFHVIYCSVSGGDGATIYYGAGTETGNEVHGDPTGQDVRYVYVVQSGSYTPFQVTIQVEEI